MPKITKTKFQNYQPHDSIVCQQLSIDIYSAFGTFRIGTFNTSNSVMNSDHSIPFPMIFDLPSSEGSDSSESDSDMAIAFNRLFSEDQDNEHEYPEVVVVDGVFPNQWILAQDFWESAFRTESSSDSDSIFSFTQDYDNQVPIHSLERLEAENQQLIRFTRELHAEVEELIEAGVRVPNTNSRAFFQQLAEDILTARHEILSHRLIMLNSGVIQRETDELLMDYFLESAQASVLAARFARQEEEDLANVDGEESSGGDGDNDAHDNADFESPAPVVVEDDERFIKDMFEATLIFLALFFLGLILDLVFKNSFRKF